MAPSSADSGPGLFDDPPDPEPGLRPARSSAPPVREPEVPAPPAPVEPRTFTVGELTGEIGDRLDSFGKVRVEGELSGLKHHTSGHTYFDLKGDGARLSCVIWKSALARAVRFRPEDGVQVLATGKLGVYRPRGSYSLHVDKLEPTGIGQLLARLEELKAELRALGWFERRRELPAMPRLVGVVTSRDGAALRDFLRTRSLRWPGYPVRLCHAPVQGPGAAEALAEAIQRLDRSGVDVLVVCRGGGSLEDLWAFNERPVAEAIRAASVPVVSGVGHESDTTLADLVADHRAHTPTDAAQSVIPERRLLDERLERLQGWLTSALARALDERAARLAGLRERRVLRDPSWIVADRLAAAGALERRLGHAARARLSTLRGELAELRVRLERRSPAAWVGRRRETLLRLGERLVARASVVPERSASRLASLTRSLEAVSPLAVLGRGYSITQRVDGPGSGEAAALVDAATLAPGDELRTRLARGAVVSRVSRIEPAG